MGTQNESPQLAATSEGASQRKYVNDNIISKVLKISNILNANDPERWPEEIHLSPKRSANVERAYFRCPNRDHADHTPSAYIYEKAGGIEYRCMSASCCHTQKSLAECLVEISGISFEEASALTGNKATPEEIRHERTIIDALTPFFSKQYQESSSAQEYMASRKLEETRVGYAPEGWTETAEKLADQLGIKNQDLTVGGVNLFSKTGHPIFKDAVVFPIRNKGKGVVGFQTRCITPDIEKKYRWRTFSKLLVYGLDTFDPNADRVIIVEGIPDAEAWWAAGYTNVIAFLGKNNIDPEGVKALKGFRGEIVVIIDSDKMSGGDGFTFYDNFVAATGLKCFAMEWPNPDDFDPGKYGIDPNRFGTGVRPDTRKELRDYFQDSNSMLQLFDDPKKFREYVGELLEGDSKISLEDRLTTILNSTTDQKERRKRIPALLAKMDEMIREGFIKDWRRGLPPDLQMSSITKFAKYLGLDEITDSGNFSMLSDFTINAHGALMCGKKTISRYCPTVLKQLNDLTGGEPIIEWSVNDGNGGVYLGVTPKNVFYKNKIDFRTAIAKNSPLHVSILNTEYLQEFFVASLSEVVKLNCLARPGFDSTESPSCASIGKNVYGEEGIEAHYPEGMDEKKQYQIKGSREVWMEGFEKIRDRKLIVFLLFAAFASPLLSIVKAPSFVILVNGPKATGKSSTLALIASVFGDPTHGIIGTTQVTADRLFKALERAGGLPLFFEDVHLWSGKGNTIDLKTTIFDIYSGQGKKGGGIGEETTKDRRFRSIAIMTTNESNDAALSDAGQSRLFPVNAIPLEKGEWELADIIKDIGEENFGIIGHELFTALFANKDKWDDYKTRYRELKKEWKGFIGSGDPRRTDYLAVMELAGLLMNEYLNLGFTREEIRAIVMEQFTRLQGQEETIDDKFYIPHQLNRFLMAHRDNMSYFGKSRDDDEDGGSRLFTPPSHMKKYGFYYQTEKDCFGKMAIKERHHAITEVCIEDFAKEIKLKPTLIIAELNKLGLLASRMKDKNKITLKWSVKLDPTHTVGTLCYRYLTEQADEMLGDAVTDASTDPAEQAADAVIQNLKSFEVEEIPC